MSSITLLVQVQVKLLDYHIEIHVECVHFSFIFLGFVQLDTVKDIRTSVLESYFPVDDSIAGGSGFASARTEKKKKSINDFSHVYVFQRNKMTLGFNFMSIRPVTLFSEWRQNAQLLNQTLSLRIHKINSTV